MGTSQSAPLRSLRAPSCLQGTVLRFRIGVEILNQVLRRFRNRDESPMHEESLLTRTPQGARASVVNNPLRKSMIESKASKKPKVYVRWYDRKLDSMIEPTHVQIICGNCSMPETDN